MSYPPLPSNGETNWGTKFRAWADALEGRKVEGEGLSLRRDTSSGERVFLDRPDGGSTMLYGDTGWRDITDNLPPGLVKSSSQNAILGAAIRRIGRQVELEVFVDILEPGISVILPIPLSFRPTQRISRNGNLLTATSLGSGLPTTLTASYVSFTALASASALPEGGTAQYTGAWVTPNIWPTTLPGTPA